MKKKTKQPHRSAAHKEIMAKLAAILAGVRDLKNQGEDKAGLKAVAKELDNDADGLADTVKP